MLYLQRMIGKLLLLALVIALVVGGRRRIGSLAQSVVSLPSSFREGRSRAEDPAAHAKEVRGAARDVDERR